MSWETEALAENPKDLQEYTGKVIKDYFQQVKIPTIALDGKTQIMHTPDFIKFLITRMYYEGLPAKEPIDLVVTGVYKVPE